MWRRMSSALTESSAGLSSAGSPAAAEGVGVVAAVLFDGAVVVHAPAYASRAASAKAAKKRLFIVRVASLKKRSVCCRTLRRAPRRSQTRRGTEAAGTCGLRPTRQTSSNRAAATVCYKRAVLSYNLG